MYHLKLYMQIKCDFVWSYLDRVLSIDNTRVGNVGYLIHFLTYLFICNFYICTSSVPGVKDGVSSIKDISTITCDETP